jgi:hypothetical protein
VTPRSDIESGHALVGTVLDMASDTHLPTLPLTITDPSDREARQRLTSRAR